MIDSISIEDSLKRIAFSLEKLVELKKEDGRRLDRLEDIVRKWDSRYDEVFNMTIKNMRKANAILENQLREEEDNLPF